MNSRHTVILMTVIVPALLAAAFGFSPGPAEKQDLVLYRHEGRYSAFPGLSARGNQLWVSFGWNTSRSHYGKAAGGETGSVSLYSPDGGRRWLEKGRDTDYSPPPAENAWFLLERRHATANRTADARGFARREEGLASIVPELM